MRLDKPRIAPMTTSIAQNRIGIERLCKRYSVKRLELFGSAVTRGEFTDGRSDLDFFVEFTDTDYRGASDRYFGLMHGLEDLLQCSIDLIETSMIRSRIFLEVSRQHTEEIYNDATACKLLEDLIEKGLPILQRELDDLLS